MKNFNPLCHSSRYFHWKLNLYVILLVLIFVVPFYIGYFVVSNIRLCKYCWLAELSMEKNTDDSYRCYFTHYVTESCLLCVCVVQRQRLLFACMVWFTFMYFFWKLGDPFPILSPKHGECASFSSLGTCMNVDAFFLIMWESVESMVSLLSVGCCFYFRHPVNWAAYQSCWCDRSHTHGSVVWVWCGQLSLHVHVLFPQVSSYHTAC